MTVNFHRKFVKQYAILRKEEKARFEERLALFVKNPFHSMLRNHELRGKYAGYRSIAIGGDLRAIYKQLPPNICLFSEIGTHHELYDK